VRCIGVLDSLTELRGAIADWHPDIVFNLLENSDGIVTYDQHVVAFLDSCASRTRACNPRGLLLSRDKSLSKQLLAFHRIATRSSPCSGAVRAFMLPRSCVSRCS